MSLLTAEPGDLVWTDFDPTAGREQARRRPALVVSVRPFNEATGFLVVCPVTRRVRPFPTSVVLPEGLPITGEILLSAVRSIDAQARTVRPIGARVPPVILDEVRAKLAAILGI